MKHALTLHALTLRQLSRFITRHLVCVHYTYRGLPLFSHALRFALSIIHRIEEQNTGLRTSLTYMWKSPLMKISTISEYIKLHSWGNVTTMILKIMACPTNFTDLWLSYGLLLCEQLKVMLWYSCRDVGSSYTTACIHILQLWNEISHAVICVNLT